MPAHRKEDEEQPLLHEPLKPAAIEAAAFACLSGILLGYDIGITNGALLPIEKYFNLNHKEIELFVGMLSLCALPGCMIGSYLTEWVGRRGAIGLGAALSLAGNSMVTFALTYPVLILGRALSGIAVGMILVVEPLYTGEIAPARLRGMLSTNVELSFNIGIVCGFLVAYLLANTPHSYSWRVMFGLCLFAPTMSLLGVCCVLPESPRWLASRGRYGEAEASLKLLLGPIEAKKSIQLMQEDGKNGGKDADMTWSEMFLSKDTRWLLFLGGGVAFFSQAIGTECIMYYSSTILHQGGLDRNRLLLAILIMGCIKLAANITQGSVVDTIGRRPLLVVSSLGMSLAMLMLGLSFILAWSAQFKIIPILIFVVLDSLGYGPLVYTLNAELYPTSCRAKGLTFAMGIERSISALVSVRFLTLANYMTMGGAFIFFSAWGALAAVFVVCLIPETMGKSLEETKHCV